MNFNRLISLKNIVLLFIIFVLLFVGYQVFLASKPMADIVIKDFHDPINNYVFVNGQRVFPQGQEGRTYKPVLKSGENTISINGPFIDTAEETIEASQFGKYQTEISTKKITPEQIIRKTLEEPEAKITLLRLFDSNNIAVFRLEGEIRTSKKTNSRIIRYDLVARAWSDITSSFIDNPELFKIDEDAKNYLFELLED